MAAFFFITTMGQLVYLNLTYSQIPHVELGKYTYVAPEKEVFTIEQQMSARKFEILASMEAYVVERRYYQSAMATMSLLWIRYLGFVTGMILALVGAIFILARLQESRSEIKAKWNAANFLLRSASPGIVLVVLGTILMYATIIDRDTVETFESRIYLTDSSTLMTTPTPTAQTDEGPTLIPLEENTSLPASTPLP